MVRVRMSDGRELLGRGVAGGDIMLVGGSKAVSQFSLDLVRPTAWRALDQRALEEFESDG